MGIFKSPKKSSLFSNAVISLLLNILILKNLISFDIEISDKKGNEISKELISLFTNPQFSSQSTNKIRTIVKLKCFKAQQLTRNFNDKLQHDAGEFMASLLEHLFLENLLLIDIDEKVFGGLSQEKITCNCGKSRLLPIQKLPEILSIQIEDSSIQTCLDNFFSREDIDLECDNCKSLKTKKETCIILEPTTLIIQLKRYEFDHNKKKILKKQDSVICPNKIRLPEGSTYSLSSVLNHIGSSPDNGHYTVSLFDEETNSFVMIDDSTITENVTFSEEVCKLSYLVCYNKD